tara:strand:- start:410 stop:544 length:135 start_codon:yes stop_codon:yes gene_type:complete
MLLADKIELIFSNISGLFSKYLSVNHLFKACFESFNSCFACSNL